MVVRKDLKISLRISTTDLEKIRTLADEDGRSVSAELVWFALQEWGKRVKKEEDESMDAAIERRWRQELEYERRREE